MHQYKKLDFWKRSCSFCTSLYSLTSNFPESEKFGLTSQLRRASISIASNIAEGASRKSNKDFSRFLEIAIGSAFEVETQLLISQNLAFNNSNELQETTDELTIIIRQMRKFKEMLDNQSC